MTNTAQSLSASIISFPKDRIMREIPDETRSVLVQQAQEKSTVGFADNVVTGMSASIYEELKECGLDVATPQFNTDFTYLTSTLSAVIYRILGLEHPFQNVVDLIEFTEVEDVDETEPEKTV